MNNLFETLSANNNFVIDKNQIAPVFHGGYLILIFSFPV